MSAPRHVFITRAEASDGVVLHIVAAPESVLRGSLDHEAEAGAIIDALLELPVETRNAFYLLLTTEHAEGFCAAKRPKAKRHDWPPTPRRPT